MKLLIAIPSFSRPYSILKKCNWLLEVSKNHDLKVFIEPRETIYYRQVLPDSLIETTNNENYICGQVYDISQYAIDNGYDWVFKIDDDMRFKEYGTRVHEVAKVFDKHLCLLKDKLSKEGQGIASIDIGKAMSYIRSPRKGFVERRKPIYCSYIVRPSDMAKIKKHYYFFDDVIIGIIAAQSGKLMLRYNGCFEDNVIQKNKGGAQSYDRDMFNRKAFIEILKDYPECTEWKDSKLGMFDIDINSYFKKVAQLP